jgi:hypothetical protein
MMVLYDFLSKHIAPLLERSRPAWLYTGVNDSMCLEHGAGSTWEADKLMTSLAKLSPNPSPPDLITPPASCQPICMDQAARMALLKSMPTLDDIDIASVLRGDQFCGVVIHEMDATGNQRGEAVGGQGGVVASGQSDDAIGDHDGSVVGGAGGMSSALAPSKGKEKQAQVIADDNEVSFDEDLPRYRSLPELRTGESTI